MAGGPHLSGGVFPSLLEYSRVDVSRVLSSYFAINIVIYSVPKCIFGYQQHKPSTNQLSGMKPTMVALLILMNMMCTIGYFDHASFLGTKAQETSFLANSYSTHEESGSTKGINIGRKLAVTDRKWLPRDVCCNIMSFNSCKEQYKC
ncbi:hypothetical protein SORBI_3006G025700 [Sorghum bicolor]|uniref:Uncharacterized protein n=1 Tax=Sorghum bicolor TaxID=4558 RepID=A0A1B6PJM6_SORBI|nr:hypothetical protein SORBI_3006G025700 [Sorghum bicolor]